MPRIVITVAVLVALTSGSPACSDQSLPPTIPEEDGSVLDPEREAEPPDASDAVDAAAPDAALTDAGPLEGTPEVVTPW
jgi:hypothetical protein